MKGLEQRPTVLEPDINAEDKSGDTRENLEDIRTFLMHVCVRGGQPFFLTLKGGGQQFFLTETGGGQTFFSHFCDLPQ